jgi:hypothetical protein
MGGGTEDQGEDHRPGRRLAARDAKRRQSPDVRLTIRTDDGQLIFMTYSGAIQTSKVQVDSLGTGATFKADDFYFITAPTFETNCEKYAWL